MAMDTCAVFRWLVARGDVLDLGVVCFLFVICCASCYFHGRKEVNIRKLCSEQVETLSGKHRSHDSCQVELYNKACLGISCSSLMRSGPDFIVASLKLTKSHKFAFLSDFSIKAQKRNEFLKYKNTFVSQASDRKAKQDLQLIELFGTGERGHPHGA